MAIAKKGSTRGFTGKLGKTVIYPLKGQLVERTIGELTKPASTLQEAGRQVTTLIVHLLRPVMPFIRIGFKLATENTTSSAYNLACSVNRLNVISGNYPDQEVDYSKVLFSKGVLPVNEKVSVSLDHSGVRFSWDPEFLIRGMKPTDQVMVMAYCPEKHCAFCIIDGARRKDGVEKINLPKYNEKMIYHTYITFIASNRESISNSFYLEDVLY